MPLIVQKQLTPEWFKAHRGRITASTAAACLGLDPGRSRQKAFRLITGKEEEATNWWMKWGTENEERARTAYECETGQLTDPTGFWVHPKLDWLGASPDGLIGRDGMVELKCPQTLPSEIPMKHAIQMQVQMCVCGREWCDYFAWAPDGTHYLARVYADLGNLVELLEVFHKEYVTADLQPPRRKRAKRKPEMDDESEGVSAPALKG